MQIKRVLTTSLKAYEALFDPDNVINLPRFRLQLEVDKDQNQIQFYPYLDELETTIGTYVVTKVCSAGQDLETIQVYSYTVNCCIL